MRGMSSETEVLLLASFSAKNSLIFAVLIITALNSLSTLDAVLDSCNSTSFFLIDARETQKYFNMMASQACNISPAKMQLANKMHPSTLGT